MYKSKRNQECVSLDLVVKNVYLLINMAVVLCRGIWDEWIKLVVS